MLQDIEGACLKVCGGCDGRSEGRTEYGQIGIRIGRTEVGIYKRKQELDQESDQEKRKFFFFFSWSLSWSSSCFISCFLVFLLSCFLL